MPNALSRTTLALLLVVGFSAALPSSIMAQQEFAAADEQPKPERNPPGDIPDNQVFIDYVSPLGHGTRDCLDAGCAA
jgi:hypothetical protein